jgi:VanZ family protein
MRFLKYWLPVLLWMLVIFGASTGMGSPQHTSRFIRPLLLWINPDMSPEALATAHFCVRKAAHFVEYAILAALLMRALRGEHFSSSCQRQMVLVVLLCALYAAGDELHQSFVRGREASAVDVLIDSCGAGIGTLAFWAAGHRRKGR